jgi:hypothetical protein
LAIPASLDRDLAGRYQFTQLGQRHGPPVASRGQLGGKPADRVEVGYILRVVAQNGGEFREAALASRLTQTRKDLGQIQTAKLPHISDEPLAGDNRPHDLIE